MSTHDLTIKNLGKCSVKSPLNLSKASGDGIFNYVTNDDKILHDTTLQGFLNAKESNEIPMAFEKAGPREFLYYDPAKTKVAIVTCGGLCPGLNNIKLHGFLESNTDTKDLSPLISIQSLN